MIDEQLVDLDGPVGRCSSTAAVEVARRLAIGRDGSARLHRISSHEGIHDDATATRWEVCFDLPERVSVLDVVVTFSWSEDDRRFGRGIASLVETRFPAPGSELERMAVSRALSRRRIRGIWRQTIAGHRHLPRDLPDASEAATLLRAEHKPLGALRSLQATVLRSGGPCWLVVGSEARYRVRWSTTPRGTHLLHT